MSTAAINGIVSARRTICLLHKTDVGGSTGGIKNESHCRNFIILEQIQMLIQLSGDPAVTLYKCHHRLKVTLS